MRRPLRLSNMRRRRGRRHPQFLNLGRNRPIFLSGAHFFLFHTPGLPRQRPQLDQNLSPSGSGCGKPDWRDSHGGRRRGPRSSRTSRPQIRWARNVLFYQLRIRTSRTFFQCQGYDIIFNTEVNSSTWEA